MSTIFYRISLRDVVLTQKGVKPVILKTKVFEDSLPYLDINALETGEIKEYSFKELGNIANEQDVLVVWDGSRSGLALKGQHGIIGSTLMKLTPVGISTEYLYYFIKSQYEYINGNLTGGGIPHVNSDVFFDLRIPYIPFENQKEVIIELHSKIQENVSILSNQKNIIRKVLSDNEMDFSDKESISDVINNFRKAILERGINGELTSKWRKEKNISFPKKLVSLDSIITEIKSGKSFRCLERPPINNEIGVLKISAISSKGYQEEESKTCIDKTKINPVLFIKKGDFLITRANTKELVGACVIVEEVSKKIMLSDKILRVTFDNTKVLDQYILLFLQSKDGREQIENYATGSQESMKNITQAELKSMLLKIPNLMEQREIIRQTNLLLGVANKIQNQYKNAIEIFDKLERSLLQQVFDEDFLKKYQTNILFEKILDDIKTQKIQLEIDRTAVNKKRSKAKSIMKKAVTEISTLDVEDVLRQTSEPLSAKEVWKASKYAKDIDAFYEAVKHKVPTVIDWEITKKDEEVPVSIISLKNKL